MIVVGGIFKKKYPFKMTGQQGQISNDVQTYLIDNYREAVRQGDRSAAKSCLLAARYFSVDDPIVMNEIYLMAKSDGDINEASKCFASLVKLLLPSDNHRSESNGSGSNHPTALISRIKDEIELYLSQLKSKSLQLKSKPPATLSSRDRAEPGPTRLHSRDPQSQLSQSLSQVSLHSRSDIVFYHQLFENLPADVNKSIIDQTIDSCEDCFEQCRLMLLSMSVFPDSVDTYSNRLLARLIEIVRTTEWRDDYREYASSLLVLDAIPLVLRLIPLSRLTLDIGELFSHILGYYSRHCLKVAAEEYSYNELEDGLRKSIAERILCKESDHLYEDVIEDNINSTFDLLYDKYLEETNDENIQSFLNEFSTIVTGGPMTIFQLLERQIGSLRIMIAERSTNDQPQTSSLPKPRGRAKKSQTPDILPDNKLLSEASLFKVVFFTLVRRLFKSSALYLRQTRSSILIDFDNPNTRDGTEEESESHPLARFRKLHSIVSSASTESHEFAKPQFARPSPDSPLLKKIRLEREQRERNRPYIAPVGQPSKESPLNSAFSREMDEKIIANLCVARQCIDLILEKKYLNRLWSDFLNQNSIESCYWYRRILVDTSIFKQQYDEASDILQSIVSDCKDASGIMVDQYSSVKMLRAFAQLVCCEIIDRRQEKPFLYVDHLLVELRKNGIAAASDNYFGGDVMKEYKVIVLQNLGFLFFDSLPLIRFCVDALTSFLHRTVFEMDGLTDTIVGHTIALSQFDWPKYAHVYELCIEWIRNSKPKSVTPQCLSDATKFTYPEFFQFVKNPTIIEDFMALLNQGYTLDFKDNSPNSSSAANQPSTSRNSSSSSSRSGKAITTRGVNKNFKEDLKVTLTAQMKNSISIVPLELMLDFIQAFLLPRLNKDL